MLPKGITRKLAREARQIRSHPEAMALVIRKARKASDIPTRAAVLREIGIRKRAGVPPSPPGYKSIMRLLRNAESAIALALEYFEAGCWGGERDSVRRIVADVIELLQGFLPSPRFPADIEAASEVSEEASQAMRDILNRKKRRS